jgi:hypothetical protein
MRSPAGEEGISMKADPIRGKTIRWTFDDGVLANRTFEHVFGQDGSVTFRMLGGKTEAQPTRVDTCEVATLGADVDVISYLGPAGYTLTVVLDHRSGRIVASSSNEEELALQHGTFEEVGGAKTEVRPPTARPSRRRVSWS